MWLVAQIPIPIQLLIIAGTAFWIFLLGASRAGQFPGRPVALTPFAVQAFLLPVAVVVAGSVLYDGIRHLMFAVAAFPAFMACVIALLEFRVTSLKQSQQVKARMHIGVAVAVGALLFGTASIIAWFPYQYAYINVVATRFEGERPWELDFWGVTALEGTRKLQTMGASEVVILPQMAYPGTPEIVGALSVDQARELGDESVGVYTFLRYDTSLPEGCTTEFTIDRANQLLGVGGLCPAAVFNPTED